MGEIVDRRNVPALVATLREHGKTIVTMNGSFDVLHAGHIRCLQEAKEQGDVLVVPLNSDESIRSYKGKERPINPQEDRAEMLTALSCVDYVVLFDETNSKSILLEIRPDVHCNGADWGPGCIEQEVVERNGGRLHILAWAPGCSTTRIMDRIRTGTRSPAAFIVSKSLLGKEDALTAHAVLLKRAASHGLKLVVFSEEPDIESTRRLLADHGVTFDGVYTCSRGPDGQPEHATAAALVAMLEDVRDDLGLALGSSWVVSDKMRHVIMGRELNSKTILVGTAPKGHVMPHNEVRDLEEAVSVATA